MGTSELYSSCGSGVTACTITFAAHLAGFKQLAVYDGSWCEWGQAELELPIESLLSTLTQT
jgi:thiosulfate/3-mercaptopyruvate sulfurtransferase